MKYALAFIGISIFALMVYFAVEDAVFDGAYMKVVRQAQADCANRDGSEFRPYGFASWLQTFGSRPQLYACIRFGSVLNRRIAFYTIHWDGKKFVTDVR